MYKFSEDPPPDPKGRTFTLVRTPQGASRKGIITCTRSLSIPTHYWGGRTIPHPEENCPACAEGMAYLWHTYVSAWSEKHRTPFIFECTATAGENYLLYLKAHGTLRGCEFTARRLGQRANSRVLIETKPAMLEAIKLPQPPDLLACMCRIWNVPVADAYVGRPEAPETIATITRSDGAQDITRPQLAPETLGANGKGNAR